VSQIFVLSVPREAVLAALSDTLPEKFTQVVFAQWDPETDSVMIGLSEAHAEVRIVPLPDRREIN